MVVEQREQGFVRKVLGSGVLPLEVVEKAVRTAYAGDRHRPVFAVVVESGFLEPEAADSLLRRLIGIERDPDESSDSQVFADQLTRAFDQLDRAVQVSPGEESVYWIRARTRWGERRYQDTIRDCTTLLTLSDRKAEAHALRARAHARLLAFDEAIADLQEAIQFDPDPVDYHFELGCCYQALGRPEEASAIYGQVLERETNHLEGLYHRSVVRLSTGDLSGAVVDWQGALESETGRTTVSIDVDTLLGSYRG